MKKTSLYHAIAYLKSAGIIKRDAEIAEKMEMSKGTLSAYVTGTTRPSKKFVEKFENLFSVKIDDFNSLATLEEARVKFSSNLNQSISEHEERLLRVEAHLEVFESAIAGLLSKDHSDFLNKVGELRKAVQEAVNRRFEELRLKHG